MGGLVGPELPPLYSKNGAPDRIRTCGLRLRRPTLYPAELRALVMTPRPIAGRRSSGRIGLCERISRLSYNARRRDRLRLCLALMLSAILLSAQTPPPPTIAAGEYQARRAAVSKAIGPEAVFIAFSFEPARRTGDVDWPFRQEDNLLYLTGMNAPETTLVLLPGEPDHRELIFAPDRDASNERWTGHIASPEEVTSATGVREILSARRF